MIRFEIIAIKKEIPHSNIDEVAIIIDRKLKKTAMVGMIMIFSIALDLYCHENTGLQYLQSSQYKKAYEVFKKNSYVDHAEDQFYLGAMFSEGIYVKKDIDRALYWISKSAENGFPAAQYIYALYLFDGKYIPVDYQNGEFWLRKAATNNYSDAQNTLAVFLYYGIYIKQNKKEAIYWLKKAYQNGNRAAAISVAKLYIYGSDFIKQDKKKGFEILRNESLKRPRNVEACFYLGVHLIFGIYIKKNIAAGTACIDYAVAQGYPPAYLVKGICQMLGYGYKKNHPEGTLNMIHFFFCNSRGAAKDKMMLMAEEPKEAIGPFKKASLEKEIFISIAHFEHNKIQEGANCLADGL